MKVHIAIGMLAAVAALSFSCSKGDYEDAGASKELSSADGKMEFGSISESGGVPDEGRTEGGNTQAGRITAGEWNDLDHWDLWSSLMDASDDNKNAEYSYSWGFWTNNRVAVQVSDALGNPLCGVGVKLVRNGEDGSVSDIWKARTDVHGRADCWIGLFQKTVDVDPSGFAVVLDGAVMEGEPMISGWNPEQGAAINRYVVDAGPSVANAAEICFIVDATGSMGDEMGFLKDDLSDIIGKVAAFDTECAIRTSALFYRDEGDDYVTKASDFSDKLSVTTGFVKEQKANGGGDYPEAVHTALEKAVQNLSWKEDASCKLAFMLLDAPAHMNDSVRESLHKSMELYAANGIKLIPIAASGVDKSTEFMLRFFSVTTGGTYVFITNDSGIGYDHIEPTVGDYQVEQLNDLIVRLIKYYLQ